jgi:phosphoglycolate phosphatase
MITSVLFDFDGTLVHSAPGILAGFTRVLAAEGLSPREAIDQRVIGPPLLATIRRLTGLEDEAKIEKLAAAFRATYDADGILEADPYPALMETLTALAAAGRKSYVVTNKRRVPTRLIADRLGVTAHMTALYSLDSLAPPAPRKVAVVRHILEQHAIDPAEAVLVGDSAEDAEAAAENDVRFIAAAYGYGNPSSFTKRQAVGTIASLAELPALLASLD